jgi:rubrerythrin
MPISKLEARELMSRGYEMGAAVLSGVVRRLEDGSWMVDDRPLELWLEEQQGSEVVLVAAGVQEGRGTRQVCRTCGTEFEGYECPRCREVHRRLRGR